MNEAAAGIDVSKLKLDACVAALLSYTLPENIKSAALRERLRDKHKIEVKVVPSNWFNGSRISTHIFNSEQDVDALVAALKIELA